MKSVYLLLTHTGTILSRVIKLFTDQPYSHVSISLDRNLERMYSFGRKYKYVPWIGAFMRESPEYGTFLRFHNTQCAVLRFNVSDNQYRRIELELERFVKIKDQLKFNLVGLVCAGKRKEHKRENSYYCAEFVRHLLSIAEIDLSDIPETAQPMDFLNLRGVETVYTGLLRFYRVSQQCSGSVGGVLTESAQTH